MSWDYRANRISILQRMIGGHGDEIAVLQSFNDLSTRDAGGADLYQPPFDMVVLQPVNADTRVLAVYGFLGKSQCIFHDVGPDFRVYVGSGDEFVIGIVDGHLDFAHL